MNLSNDQQMRVADLIDDLSYKIEELIDAKIRGIDSYWGDQSYEAKRELDKSITNLVEFCLKQKKE